MRSAHYGFMLLGLVAALVATPIRSTPQAHAVPVRAAASATDRVTVTPAQVLQKIPAGFFGINYVGFWDSAQGSAASAQALAQTPIRTIRFPGGAPGDWYDWADPYYQNWSSTSPLDLWHYAQRLGSGAAPLFQTNYQGNGLPNPPGKNYAVNSPQNQAAWVTYDMTAGIPAQMEVGNEEDISMTAPNDPVFQPYITAFNAQAQAMHKARAGVKVWGPASTNEYYWWALNSLGMFLTQTGNISGTGQVDGVSLHYYNGSTWNDSYNLAQQWAAPGGPWEFIRNTIHSYDTRALPVAITEWNMGINSLGNGFNQSVGHALVIADQIGVFAQAGVAEEDYFDLHEATQYGLLYGMGERRLVDSPTPTYYAMALWGRMGNQVVASQQSDDAGSTMSIYATSTSSGSLQVLAINKLPTAHTVQVTFNGTHLAGRHLTVSTLLAILGHYTDLDVWYNGVIDPSPRLPLPGPRNLGTLTGNTVTYTVPAYSAVVLTVT